MNREQKIALILGFAVILVVGVLVSDHWSRARELELADAAAEDPGVVRESLAVVLPGPGELERLAQRPAPGVEERADPRPADPQFELARETKDPSTGVLPGFTPVEPAPEPPLVISQGPESGTSVLEEALSGVRSDPGVESSGPTLLDRLGERLSNGLREAARIETQSELPSAKPDAEAGTQPRPVRHTVAKNESLFAIAKRYYGDGGKWRRIAGANPGKVSESGGIREGVTLLIPGAGAPAGESPRSSPERNGPVERVIASAASQYTVKKNDSLSEIAQRLLGSSKRMGEIVAANRGRINDPDDIRVGMVLTIPSKS